MGGVTATSKGGRWYQRQSREKRAAISARNQARNRVLYEARRRAHVCVICTSAVSIRDTGEPYAKCDGCRGADAAQKRADYRTDR